MEERATRTVGAYRKRIQRFKKSPNYLTVLRTHTSVKKLGGRNSNYCGQGRPYISYVPKVPIGWSGTQAWPSARRKATDLDVLEPVNDLVLRYLSENRVGNREQLPQFSDVPTSLSPFGLALC